MLLAKCPPPSEAHQVAQLERRLAFALFQLLHKGDDRLERFIGASIVRHDARLAAEIEHSLFVLGVETELVQHQHAFRFSQNVVVQRAFGDVEMRRGLSETHFLRHDRVDGLLQGLL